MIARLKFSVEDYHKMIDIGILVDKKVELIDGEIIEVSPEKPFHAGTNNELFGYLFLKLQTVACVRMGLPITLLSSEPEPDICICKLDRSGYKISHPTPENIYVVIELSNSTLDFDLKHKKKIYAADGIPEYWVVDLSKRKIYVFKSPAEGVYKSAMIAGEEDSLSILDQEVSLSKFLP